jgi:hypothetical protein
MKSDVNFSKQAVNKAVLKNTLQHPSVLYPATVGILSLAAATVLGATLPLIAVGIGGGSIAGVSWLTNYFARKERFANEYVQKLYNDMEAKRLSHTTKLTEILQKVNTEQGLSQFERLKVKFDTFGELLKDKLDPQELTYSRYRGMAEQVYTGSLDNLYDIANILKGVNIIDHKHVESRIAELENLKGLSDKQQRELATLNERLNLRQSQLEKVEHFFSQNEEAMTQIDQTIAAIAEMRTESERASMDLESAMNRLSDLAKRAKQYSN